MKSLAEDKQTGHCAAYPGLYPILGPHWPPKRSMSVAEVVAGAETGSVAGAGVAAAAVAATAAAGAAAAEGAVAAAPASAGCPSTRSASEAPSVAAGVAMQINPVIQMPQPSHKPQKRKIGEEKEKIGGRQQFKETEKIQTWCVVRD